MLEFPLQSRLRHATSLGKTISGAVAIDQAPAPAKGA
jgi:hypothetical protein